MVSPKTITKKQAVKMFKLYRKMTKAEVRARLGPIDSHLNFVGYATRKIDLENELREFLFGHSGLYELGVMWGIIEPIKRERKRKKNGKG